MDELLKKKLEIAKRAGELNAQIERLSKIASVITKNKSVNYGDKVGVETIHLQLSTEGLSSRTEINSFEIDKGGTELHDALLLFLNSQIDKRKVELNELIKVLV